MLLDGKETAKQIKIELKEKIKTLKETYNKVPTIAIVLNICTQQNKSSVFCWYESSTSKT